MTEKEYLEAQKDALASVYKDIATTGKPTDSQLSFIRMMQPKKSQFSEFEDAGKALMAVMGFMEGK